jgi:hypothetical protein
MKLYTEEQVKKYIFEEGFIEIFDFENDLIPSIELPSDEEITDKALEVGYTNNLFTLGAKWMRDKIKGGKK